MATEMYDLFISHNSLDKPLVDLIVQRLYAEFEIRSWLDKWDLYAAEDWAPAIEKALAACTVCAVFLGSNGWGHYHLEEAKLALKRREKEPDFKVIPVLLPGASAEDMAVMGDFFQRIQRVDFSNSIADEEAFRRLLAAIRGEAPGPPPMTVFTIRRDAERWRQSSVADKNSVLYQGGELRNAQKIAEQHAEQLSDLAVKFLSASATEEHLRIQKERKRVRRIIAGLVVGLIAVAISAGIAFAQRNEAKKQAAIAEIRRDESELQTQIAEQGTKIAQSQKRIADIQTEIATQQKVIADANNHISEVRTKIADEQKAIAEAEAKIAELQRRKAEKARELERLARNRAEGLYKTALDEIGLSFVELGTLRSKDDPAFAVRVALTAADLADTKSSADLLTSTLERTPVWCRIGPENAGQAYTALTIPTISPRDVFATDPDISVVLGTLKSRADNSQGDPSELVLRAVPSGQIVATHELTPGEVFITPRTQTTRLFATALTYEHRISVYGLTADSFRQPLLRVDGALDIAFTGGTWPVHVLTINGEIYSYDSPMDEHPSFRGQVIGAHTIHAHPSGGGLVVMAKDTLVWIDLTKGSKDARSLVRIPWPNLPPFNTFAYLEEMCDLRWGPEPNKFLILQRLTKGNDPFKFDSTLYAIDGARGIKQEVRKTEFHQHGLNRWFFETDPKGLRVANVVEEPSHGTILEILDLDWKTSAAQVTNVSVPSVGRLVGQRTEVLESFAAAATISPNRNYIVVASYLKSPDNDGGSANNGVGLIESWDLTRLYATKGEEFQSYNASISSGDKPSVNSKVLQPEAVFWAPDKVPQELGTAPILRLAYSKDSSRLLAWDYRGVSHIFRVRTSHGYDRMPEEWSTRLTKPQITVDGPHGRFLIVRYGDGEYRVYDRSKLSEVRLSELVGPSSIISVKYYHSSDGLIIITQDDLFLVQRGSVTKRVHLDSKAGQVIWSDELITIVTNLGATILDVNDLKPVAKLDRSGLAADLITLLETQVENGNSTELSISKWIRIDEHKFRICFDVGTSFETWVLNLPLGSGRAEVSRAISDIAHGDSVERWDWITARRLFQPDILLVNRGSHKGFSTFEQYDLSTGRQVTRYNPPKAGWPTQIAELEEALTMNGQTFILFRYWRKGEYKDHYAIGTWPQNGGDCESWIDLGTFENNPLYIDLECGATSPCFMFWNEYAGTTATFVRAIDGKVLWHGDAAYPSINTPYLAPSSNSKWLPASLKWDEKVGLDIALRGRDYWQHITTVDLPDEQRKRIENLEQINGR